MLFESLDKLLSFFGISAFQERQCHRKVFDWNLMHMLKYKVDQFGIQYFKVLLFYVFIVFGHNFCEH
jgi:hypothetical protein